MRQFRSLILLFLFMAPVAALSALSADDLPGMSKWYFHADFKQMRSSEAGQHLYAWLQDEVFGDCLLYTSDAADDQGLGGSSGGGGGG